ncbi:hypothetical protein ES705_44247 [subsurface metagenome]
MYAGTATGSGNITFGKHETGAAHNRPGDLVAVQISNLYTAAAGGAEASTPVVVDMGADYIDVQEDESLHLVMYSSIAAGICYGRVVIYYVDA